ncbi:MAG TPA: dimethyl sulfoxide reductase anchor subunit [Thermoanaerobaculia bacterium]|nr:dimethyl sulfoxide reductase anchor subunit [Thermoanaerobaculia bacterium]HQN07750.1 dimethyl sulfoxide reductase anchor subunit [Thermoanaerobaculia bacterium]HQP86029.1 dimethyl sulfoxide reductase anchor subunit [Thermoanaerobaculia bacterium]
MREASLVAFTLLSQAAVGICGVLLALALRAERAGTSAALEAVALPLLAAALVAAVLGLAASFLHLGSPRNAWRALRNVRTSSLSREVFLASLFTAALAAAVLVRLRTDPPGFAAGFAEGFASVLGVGLVMTMAGAYRLRTVPAWDRVATPLAFFGSALVLGKLSVAAALALRGPDAASGACTVRLVIGGLAVLLAGLGVTLFWLRRIGRERGASREAFDRTAGASRRLVAARIVLTALAAGAGLGAFAGELAAWFVVATLVLAFAAETAGRVLFYEARVRSGL